jgi:hypothetical protein
MSKAEVDDARIRAKETGDNNSHNPFGEYGVKPAKSPFDFEANHHDLKHECQHLACGAACR